MRTRWNQNRASFTLVELMVVVVILGILASLITAAAMAALVVARETTIKYEVDGLATALNSYRAEFGEFPPDFTDLNMVEAHVRSRWPRITLAEINAFKALVTAPTAPALPITRAQALVFWLRGFSGSPTNPLTAGGQRVPLFDFDKTRLVDPATGFLPTNPNIIPVYISSIGGRSADGTVRPYVYFDARTYATATYVAPTGTKRPYLDSTNTSAVTYAAAESFQLIHAGLDEDYGQVNTTPSVTASANYPLGSYYAIGDRDNIVNFVKQGRTLEDSVP